jgi:hypothetical protein
MQPTGVIARAMPGTLHGFLTSWFVPCTWAQNAPRSIDLCGDVRSRWQIRHRSAAIFTDVTSELGPAFPNTSPRIPQENT